MSGTSKTSVLEDMQLLVAACYPKSQEEARRLWHDIKPIKFANLIDWTIAEEYVIASFGVPDDAAYLAVLRVESYITTNVVTAAGFGLKVPLPAAEDPTTGRAKWMAHNTPFATDADNATGLERLHAFCDNVEEFLLFKGGDLVELRAFLPANPTADVRFIRTLIYAYLLGPTISDIIGSGEVSTITSPGVVNPA